MADLGVSRTAGEKFKVIGRLPVTAKERRPIPGNKSLAHDTAGKLLCLIEQAEFEETKVSMKLFNALSHIQGLLNTVQSGPFV